MAAPDPESLPRAESDDDAHGLKQQRERIDSIDREFVRLLGERMEAVREIGNLKRDNPQTPLRDLTRERELFEEWAQLAESRGISGYFAGRVLREILNYSRRDQERFLSQHDSEKPAPRVRVGYQGIAGSYSELALGKLFASRHVERVSRLGYRTFDAALDALQAEEIDYALLPVENTIAGSINEVYRLLAQRAVSVVDEEYWPVEHCLAALPGADLTDITIIRSHPVALQQCQKFLDGCVGAHSESHFDTAASAASVAREAQRNIAAICSEDAALKHGLQVLERSISDEKSNFTRFLLIAREAESPDQRQPCRTSLIFTVNHRQGALASCLQSFANYGINLSKLESRLQPETPWEYLFYVDFDGHLESDEVKRALAEVRNHTNQLRVLGSYPRRSGDLETIPVAPGTLANSAAQKSNVVPTPAATVPTCPQPARPNLDKFPRASITDQGTHSTVRVGNVAVGNVAGTGNFVMISGPCAVESRQQILDGAAMVKRHGVQILRGGAFKPRSSPYSFQGLGFDGLDLLVEAGQAYELPVVTEVLRLEDADRIASKADLLQVGARNMQNFALLKKLGTLNRPVLLKRGMSATIDELLAAAEYIMAGGNQQVILCERGIRTFETATRNTLDVSAVPVLKARTHLPVIVDPSHAAGDRTLVIPLALAAVAAGADGLMVEAHPNPEEALCDKEQALTEGDLQFLMSSIRSLLEGQGRRWL